MFWKKASTFPDPRTPYGEGKAGLKIRARKGYTVENAYAKWTGKGGRRRKMRVGRGIGGIIINISTWFVSHVKSFTK